MSRESPTARTTGELAEALGAELDGPAGLAIERLEPLDLAGAGGLSFIRSSRFAGAWARSGASAALVSRGVDVPEHDPSSRALLIVDDADLAMARVLELFAPAPQAREPGVHATATVAPTAALGEGVAIGPHCTVGPVAVLGDRVALGPGVVVAAGARIGEDTVLHAHSVVQERCVIGARCALHPGVVIGADGFGYRPAPDGRGIVKIPHIGIVVVGDDVEIGANSCVDRAKFGSTIVGDQTKIDNLVQIGHNCVIGRACLICGHVGLSGSVTIGDGVVVAGGVGVADNLSIGAGATIAARSGVICDVPAGETWGGIPAGNLRETAPNYAAFRSLAQSVRELKKLGKRVDRLEGGA